jgi:serine/threonine-protein kinase
MAQTFDPNKLQLSGEAVSIAEGTGSVYNTAYFSASPLAVVYRPSTPTRVFQLTWFDREGKVTGQVGEPSNIVRLRFSPDGTRAVYKKETPNLSDGDLWMLDLNRGTNTRFTFGPHIADYPIWSPDGTEIVFSSNREGIFNLYRKPASGAKEEELLLRSDENKWPFSWSRDGRYLIYSSTKEAVLARQDLWVLPMQGDHTPFPFLRTRFDESWAQFSPDSRWVSYISDETGRYELYVRPFNASPNSADSGGKWLISTDGATVGGRWRDDGKELAYVTLGQRALLSVSFDAVGDAVQVGRPRELFKIPVGSNWLQSTGDLKRFLIPVPAEQKTPQAFTVMLNWTSAVQPK